MVDASGKMRLSEVRWIDSPELDPKSGTLTVTSATVTLTDASGAVAGSVSGATALHTTGASSAPFAWYLLNPTGLSLSAGVYVLAFTLTCDDGEKFTPNVMVTIAHDYE